MRTDMTAEVVAGRGGPVSEGQTGPRLDHGEEEGMLGAGQEAPTPLHLVPARSSVTPEGQRSSQPGSAGSRGSRAVGWSLSIPRPVTAQGLT